MTAAVLISPPKFLVCSEVCPAGMIQLPVTRIAVNRVQTMVCYVVCSQQTVCSLTMQELEVAGCLGSTAVFFAPPDAPLGTKLATVMAAAAAGERVRDEGGHSLVVLDDLAPLSGVCLEVSVVYYTYLVWCTQQVPILLLANHQPGRLLRLGLLNILWSVCACV